MTSWVLIPFMHKVSIKPVTESVFFYTVNIDALALCQNDPKCSILNSLDLPC